MEYAISPHFKNTDFPEVWSLDQKIEIFADRVIGWQINIAQQCADNIPHSGFAVLSIVMSYLEMIAKFKDGYINDNKDKKSGPYFKKECAQFLSILSNIAPNLRNKVADKIWAGVRCALYHTGITKDINLSGDFLSSIEYTAPYEKVDINPHRLVPDLQKHFQAYIEELRNHTNERLRSNFEARFDYQRK